MTFRRGCLVTIPNAPVVLSELQVLVDRIKERDQKLAASAEAHNECVHEQWLENGRDLLAAKKLVGHGDFGKWCEKELSYSKRTAEKLMRAAKKFGPLLENEPGSHLPCPSLVYILSAKSVPEDIFENFAHRVLAGDDVRRDLQAALKKHREKEKRDKKLAERGPEALVRQEKRDAVKVKREARDEALCDAKRERREQARSAAMELLKVRMGSDLAKLMDLVTEAGPAELFEILAAEELKARAQVSGAPAAEVGDIDSTVAEPAPTSHNELEVV